jgi:beta-lactamase regulating signal transducer with metallopeptidase domain
MTEALIDHLWQSTVFALAAAMLTLAFRKNGANIRFHIWLAASVKFLIPFSFFVLVGKHLRWETAPTVYATSELSLFMNQIVQPGAMMTGNFATATLPSAPMHWHWGAWTIMLAIWSVGFAGLIIRWMLQWVEFRAAVKASSPLDIEAPIPVRETTTALEPGVFGIFQPILLLPDGIATHLAAEQLDTILAHELCHWRRKDNLTAAIHMMVEALFWFHPLVWWLGVRMIVERERACDEAVIQSGSDRQVYAEGILKVCQLYVEPPLCAAGVSGGTLRKRIEDIMTNQVLVKLDFWKKCLLTVTGFAAIVGPFAVGLANGPHGIAQAQERTADSSPGMKHYKSSEWNFELDIPEHWNAFPAVPTNSPAEVIRFASHEDGTHNLIIFRSPYDPQMGLKAYADAIQEFLAKNGFSNFVWALTTIGSRPVATLDFDRSTPTGGTWSCRYYFIIDGTLAYTLGFGTNNYRDAMFDLYDRMAKSFVSR